jgi:peptidoglycan/LPS O-acetylase OafA/YrhL
MAIALVVAAHTLPHAYGGIVGVDVFFVLSGFLITSILIDEVGINGVISRRRFYIRRALRLLPALTVLLVLVALLQLIVKGPAKDPFFPTEGLAYLSVIGYATNWVIAFTHVKVGLFAHCWSLATEEQFYLLWPLLLVRNLRSRHFLIALVLAAVGSAAFRTYSAITASGSNENVLRADGLVAGAVLAILLYRDNRVDIIDRFKSSVAAWGSLALIGVAVMAVSTSPGDTTKSIAYVVVALGTVGLIAHVLTQPGGLIPAILRWPVVVAVGRVSYGIYLFHFPMVHTFSGRYSRPVYLFLVYSSTAALTVASWFLIESPALRRKARFEVRSPERPSPAP